MGIVVEIGATGFSNRGSCQNGAGWVGKWVQSSQSLVIRGVNVAVKMVEAGVLLTWQPGWWMWMMGGWR